MRVRAKERGYDNVAVREVGEEFDMPDDTKIDQRSWFEKVEEGDKSARGKGGKSAGDLV